MNYKIRLLSIIFLFNLNSFLHAEYTVENAFPNLSFTDPVGVYHANDNSNRLFVLATYFKLGSINKSLLPAFLKKTIFLTPN